MQRIWRAPSMRSAAAGVLAALALTSCGGSDHKAAPSPTPSHLIGVRAACDTTLRTEAATTQKLLGSPQVAIGPVGYQATVEQVAKLLTFDIPEGGGLAKARHLCAVQPKSSRGWLSITFRWEPFHSVPPLTTSTEDSSEYKGIGYAASSRDDDALIDFSCRVPSPDKQDGRGMYILATADTKGLDALGQKAKREAQLRVLHAASISVATALRCSTNLPTTLGALKPLPLDQ